METKQSCALLEMLQMEINCGGRKDVPYLDFFSDMNHRPSFMKFRYKHARWIRKTLLIFGIKSRPIVKSFRITYSPRWADQSGNGHHLTMTDFQHSCFIN